MLACPPLYDIRILCAVYFNVYTVFYICIELYIIDILFISILLFYGYSFCIDSWSCVRVGNDVIEWFTVNVGLRQGYVISPWLFNVYMDGVVREVNVRVLEKGLELLSANGGRFEINQLLFEDDTALVADSEQKLCRLVSEFGRICERRVES